MSERRLSGMVRACLVVLLCFTYATSALPSSGETVEEVSRRAKEAFNDGAYNQAETSWNQVLYLLDEANQPDTSLRITAYRSLAFSYEYLDDQERAAFYKGLWVDALRKSVVDASGGTEFPTALISLARSLQVVERWEEAEAAIKEAKAVRLKRGVELVDDEIELARHFKLQGSYERSERHYKSAIAMGGEFPGRTIAIAHNGYGALLVLLHRDDEASVQFETARRLQYQTRAK